MRWPAIFILALILVAFNHVVTRLVFAHWPSAIVVNTRALFDVIAAPLGVAMLIGLGMFVVWSLRQEFQRTPVGRWAAVLVIAGAVSNISDRLIYGGVIDYIRWFDLSTFNLADIEIVLGALLLVRSLSTKKAQPRGLR